MSQEALSQQEIDLLFGAGGGGEVAPRERRRRQPDAGDTRAYDFRRPSRVSKDRQRGLEAMYGLFTKSLEAWLAGRVRAQVELTLLSVEQFSFGEFLLSLQTPCASFVFNLEHSPGQQAIIDFGPDFAYFLVDRMLGGTGDGAPQDRALTPLERMVVRLAAERAAAELNEIWKDSVPLGPALDRFESMPEMLQIVNREDPVLVANVQVASGALRSLLLVCVPFTVLEKFFTGSGPRRPAELRPAEGERAHDRLAVEATLRQARVPVTVRFPAWRVRLGSVSDLQPGMLLETPLGPTTEVVIHVAGRARFSGTPGRAGRHVAASVVGVIDELDRDALRPATR